jgi:hypothetical protein
MPTKGAKKRKSPADRAINDVRDYRHGEATRKNNPPAKIAAGPSQGIHKE